MSSNPSRYRVVEFVPERILQAREVILAQSIAQGYDATGAVSSYGETIFYRQGALLNATVGIVGNVVTISATNSDLPIFIFVRDRWESLLSGENTAITLSATPTTSIYLNWQLALVTNVQDATLVDSSNDPAANMAELQLNISTTDLSGISLNGAGSSWNSSTQVAKNTTPIVLLNFTTVGAVSPANYAVVPQDNVLAPVLASNTTSGLVSLTTSTSGGKALSSDDAAVTNSRTPSVGSVVDASVSTSAAINATKLFYNGLSESVNNALDQILSMISSLSGTCAAHFTAALGLSNTHPMPTPSQVGAAPIAHVDEPLEAVNTSGGWTSFSPNPSHPALVDANTGGMMVIRSGTAGNGDPAIAVVDTSLTAVVSALTHDGDVLVYQNAGLSVTPGGSPLTLAPGTTTLEKVSQIGKVLTDHVNQTSATLSSGNPHGITLDSLGIANLFTINRYFFHLYATSGTRLLTTSLSTTFWDNYGINGGPFPFTDLSIPSGYVYTASASTIITVAAHTDGRNSGSGHATQLIGYVVDSSGNTNIVAYQNVQNIYDDSSVSISFSVMSGERYFVTFLDTTSSGGFATWSECVMG